MRTGRTLGGYALLFLCCPVSSRADQNESLTQDIASALAAAQLEIPSYPQDTMAIPVVAYSVSHLPCMFSSIEVSLTTSHGCYVCLYNSFHPF
ncbi:hypothetical protein BC826DRAFT_1018119 [Russula brevipes]|nr:hypothetical protein BC826DRAFT_1018119 [Russula brevipes]